MDPEIRRIWSVSVGTARTSLGVADNGKVVWATLTEDGDVEYRLEDGRLIALDQFSYHSTLIKATFREKLVLLRERYIVSQRQQTKVCEANTLYKILKEAHMTGVLGESELIEISRDIRLLYIGYAICGIHRILDGRSIHNETKHLLPEKYLVKREAAFELFKKLQTRYPEAGAILNPYAVARAAGYSKFLQHAFPDSFSDDHDSDSFHLDVYILRACEIFWGPPVPGNPDGFATRLRCEENGMTQPAEPLIKELIEKGELAKPAWMAEEFVTDQKPVITTKEQLQKLTTLSLLFSSIPETAPRNVDVQDGPWLENKEAEAKIFLGPKVCTPGWREIMAGYLGPHSQETIERPHMTSIPSTGTFGDRTAPYLVYYDYIQKLIPYQSTALSCTLARNLKASIPNPTAFKKWKDAIDECIAKKRFQIPPDVWARFKQHFPMESQPEIIETMKDE
ncbi:hypothetical protein SLS58_006524 [Diplodia intermedia]|uniref:Uncharacterized protein n=1 Tax=Diplodia intermedia TaxID=856260 RepID=A0ABR3TN02_9PEZI